MPSIHGLNGRGFSKVTGHIKNHPFWMVFYFIRKTPSFSWGVRLKATPYTEAARQGGFSSTQTNE